MQKIKLEKTPEIWRKKGETYILYLNYFIILIFSNVKVTHSYIVDLLKLKVISLKFYEKS